mmetsp:Transcript_38161/g.99931  ORF Transcript_38161/g.99931 Transcript_38161/m.99931 type:complete len:207 (-) Transcript_38161:1052-1672(-)
MILRAEHQVAGGAEATQQAIISTDWAAVHEEHALVLADVASSPLEILVDRGVQDLQLVGGDGDHHMALPAGHGRGPDGPDVGEDCVVGVLPEGLMLSQVRRGIPELGAEILQDRHVAIPLPLPIHGPQHEVQHHTLLVELLVFVFLRGVQGWARELEQIDNLQLLRGAIKHFRKALGEFLLKFLLRLRLHQIPVQGQSTDDGLRSV